MFKSSWEQRFRRDLNRHKLLMTQYVNEPILLIAIWNSKRCLISKLFHLKTPKYLRNESEMLNGKYLFMVYQRCAIKIIKTVIKLRLRLVHVLLAQLPWPPAVCSLRQFVRKSIDVFNFVKGNFRFKYAHPT